MSEIPKDDQLALWRARCRALEALIESGGREMARELGEEGATGENQPKTTEKVRQFIHEAEPYLRDGTVEGGQEAWEEVDLDPASMDEQLGSTVDGEWIGLKSIVEAPPGTPIPRQIINQAYRATENAVRELYSPELIDWEYGIGDE